ncbi:MAG: hypothetical protein JWP32_2039 [Schumannella sp.]|nr:hypothetical protein [Schumannella sp.]
MSSAEAVPVVPTPTRTRRGWDIGLSIALLVCSVVVYAVGAFIALLGIAFFGSCNGGSCSGEAVTFAAVALLVVIAVGIAGTVVLLVIRLRGWWVAAPTLLLVLLGWVVSILLGLSGA